MTRKRNCFQNIRNFQNFHNRASKTWEKLSATGCWRGTTGCRPWKGLSKAISRIAYCEKKSNSTPLCYVLFHPQTVETSSSLFLNFSFDVRDKVFSNAIHWSEEEVLGNRARFSNNRDGIGHLTLNHLEMRDEAIYRCRVDFQYAGTRNMLINLTLISKYHPTIYKDG